MRFIYYCSFSLSLLDRPIRTSAETAIPRSAVAVAPFLSQRWSFPDLARKHLLRQGQARAAQPEYFSDAGLIPWAA
jgi:hypothetical protein